MMNFLDGISAWPILKWVLLVLVAAFIGQFGKAIAQAVMGKIRLARVGKRGTEKEPSPLAEHPPTAASAALIGEKSRMIDDGVQDKKMLKALVKQQKKAAKKAKP